MDRHAFLLMNFHVWRTVAWSPASTFCTISTGSLNFRSQKGKASLNGVTQSHLDCYFSSGVKKICAHGGQTILKRQLQIGHSLLRPLNKHPSTQKQQPSFVRNIANVSSIPLHRGAMHVNRLDQILSTSIAQPWHPWSYCYILSINQEAKWEDYSLCFKTREYRNGPSFTNHRRNIINTSKTKLVNINFKSIHLPFQISIPSRHHSIFFLSF